MGRSGAGKTCSVRNFPGDKVGILSVSGKPLPFRNNGMKWFKVQAGKDEKGNYIPRTNQIINCLKKNTVKTYVIDDSQYAMSFEQMDKVNQDGYKKYTEIGKHFFDVVQAVINNTSDDTIVYFLHHTEYEKESCVQKAKTVGNMLDNWITLEGLFTIVLYAVADAEGYWFYTQSKGISTAKTPLGMFEAEKIDNDLYLVDNTIRDYYGMNGKDDK